MSKCRAKNPSRCTSPRCPDRSGGVGGGTSGGSGLFTAYDNSKSAPYAEQKTFSVKEQARQKLVQKARSLAENAVVHDDHAATLQLTRQMSEDNIANMNTSDRKAIFDYTNQSYSSLNRALRRERDLDEGEQAHVDKLDRLIADPHSPLKEPTQLYRALRPPTMYVEEGRVGEWVDNHFPEGKVVEFSSYLSTSLSKCSLVVMLKPKAEKIFNKDEDTDQPDPEWNKEVQQQTEGNVVFEIVTKDGLVSSTISHMPQETEVLMGRGKKFLVESVDQVNYKEDRNILTGEPDTYNGVQEYPSRRIRLIDTDLLL